MRSIAKSRGSRPVLAVLVSTHNLACRFIIDCKIIAQPAVTVAHKYLESTRVGECFLLRR